MKTKYRNIRNALLMLIILGLNSSCINDDYSGEPSICKNPDFEFVTGKIVCPTSENYQIGWMAEVKNKGNSAGKITVQAWLSNDKKLGNDIAAGGLVFGIANSNEVLTRTFGATLSVNVNDYQYLLLQIDHNEEVDECDEKNNLFSIEIPENYPYSLCQPKDFDAITCEDINSNTDNLSEDQIIGTNANGHVLQVGDVIIYKTNQNRCGKLEILNINDANNKKLAIKAVTYNQNGTVYSQTNFLEVRGTWQCDLDAMIEEGYIAGQQDFWWQRLNPTDSSITPRNGAKFYKFQF